MRSIGSKIRRLLQDRSGGGKYTWTAVWVIVFLMVAGVMMEFYRGYIVLRAVRDGLENAIITSATENAYNAFPGLRDGHSTLYTFTDADWEEIFDFRGVRQQMCSKYGCNEAADGSLTQYDGDKVRFKISRLQLTVSNPVYDVTGLPVSFTVTANYQIELPMLFNQHPLYVSLNQRLVSEWKPHFR